MHEESTSTKKSEGKNPLKEEEKTEG